MMRLLSEVLKRVLSKPTTRKYPKQRPEIPKGFRGRVSWNKDTCIFCGLCEINCPTSTIKVDRENKKWSIDVGKCIFCGRCHDVCPTKPKSVNLSEKYELATYDKKDLELSFEK